MKINWKDIGIRCLKTFIQGVVAYLTVSISTTDFTDKEAMAQIRPYYSTCSIM